MSTATYNGNPLDDGSDFLPYLSKQLTAYIDVGWSKTSVTTNDDSYVTFETDGHNVTFAINGEQARMTINELRRLVNIVTINRCKAIKL